MPISAISSYLPTMQQFLDHWAAANAELGLPANELKLPGSYTRANFSTDRTAIETSIIGLQPLDNAKTTAASDRDIKKAALVNRLAQFRAAVNSALFGTSFVASLSKIPEFSSAESRFLTAFDDMNALWTQINAAVGVPNFTPPLLLGGTYTLALFQTELTALRTAYLTATTTTSNLKIARDRRDILLLPARNRMKQYRAAVLARFGPGHPLVTSLPAYSPPPGSTPKPVTNFSGAWDAATGKANFTWTPSTSNSVVSVALYAADPPRYNAADESFVVRLPVGTVTASTNFGLGVPEAVKIFKAYAETADGNRKGSNLVKITRP